MKAGLGASCGRVVTDNPRDTTQRAKVVVGVAEKVIAAQMVFILGEGRRVRRNLIL